MFFRLLGPSKASYSEITFGRWRLRQERETRLAVSRDLLHFKLELTQKWWKPHRNGDGSWWMSFLSISSPNFSFIPSNSFRENRCWSHKYSFVNMIGAKLSDQRNSRNEVRFKSTNQRLASRGGFERRENRGKLPREAKRWLFTWIFIFTEE